MANGDIHKLGTLYEPWYGTEASAPSTGNLLYIGNSSSIEIKDTDSADAYKLQWVEVNDGSDKLLICDRNLLTTTWNSLNTFGFCGTKGSGKTIMNYSCLPVGQVPLFRRKSRRAMSGKNI